MLSVYFQTHIQFSSSTFYNLLVSYWLHSSHLHTTTLSLSLASPLWATIPAIVLYMHTCPTMGIVTCLSLPPPPPGWRPAVTHPGILYIDIHFNSNSYSLKLHDFLTKFPLRSLHTKIWISLLINPITSDYIILHNSYCWYSSADALILQVYCSGSDPQRELERQFPGAK